MSTAVITPNGFWLWAAGIILLDQLTKGLVRALSDPVELGPVFIGPVLNPNGFLGANLSNLLLVLFGVLIILGLGIWLVGSADNRARQLGIWLVLAGAISNLLDRVVYGGVVDIIQLGGLSHFNVADVSILAGAAVILLGSFQRRATP
jgi:signal peptidase II